MEISCPRCGALTSDQFPCIDCKSMSPIADNKGFDVGIILDKKYAAYAGLRDAIERYARREDVETFEPLRIASKGGVIVSIFRGGMLQSMDRGEMPYFHSPRTDSICLVLIFDIVNPKADRGLDAMDALGIEPLFNTKASDGSVLEFMCLDCYNDVDFCEAICSLILDKVMGLVPGASLDIKLEDGFELGDTQLWASGHDRTFRFSAVSFRELVGYFAIGAVAILMLPLSFGFFVAGLLLLRAGIVGLGIRIDAVNKIMSFPTSSKLPDPSQSVSISRSLFRYLTRGKIYFKDIDYVAPPPEQLNLPMSQVSNRAYLVVEGSFGDLCIVFRNPDERNKAYEVLIRHLRPQVKEYIRISNRMS